MVCASIISLETKACTGKCHTGGGCASAPASRPHTWIVAACEGKLSLLRKEEDGHCEAISMGESVVAPTLEQFRDTLAAKIHQGTLDKIILVGSAGDLSWTRASLPDIALRNIVAEIQYPLLPRWFNQSSGAKSLSQAVAQLFVN